MRVERVLPWRRTLAAGDARSRWTSRHGWLIVVEHDGVRGIGECSPLPGFAPASSGLAPRSAAPSFAGTPAAAMRFALETAALDALARRRGISLAAALVDRPATRVPINALVNDATSAAAAVARGIDTLKVKVGPIVSAASDAIVTAPRAALDAIVAAAPSARLRLDANQTWPPDEVDARLHALADLPIEYVEEPTVGIGPWLARSVDARADDAKALAGAVHDRAARLRLPMALDESLAAPDRDDWLDRALASGAIAALILKPTILGGFAACAALAARARAHGVAAIVTHALEGPVGTAACASLALALSGGSERGRRPSRGADRIAPGRDRDATHAVGLDRHPTLAAWAIDVPHLTADAVIDPGLPGLGLDLEAIIAASYPQEPVPGEAR